MALKYTNALRNAQLDALTSYVGPNAKLRIYNGARPATAGGALSGNTLLAEFTCGNPFASAAVNGVLTPTMPAQVNAVADGTATWFRVIKEDGSTVCFEGSIDVTGSDMNLSAVAITSGMPITLNSWTITRGNV